MDELKRIKEYFELTGYPDFDIELRPGELVTAVNAKTFVNNSIDTVELHPNNTGYETYFNSLMIYYKKVVGVRRVLNS